MDPRSLAVRHQAQRRRITQAARRAALREWRSIDQANIARSYVSILPRLSVILRAAQVRAVAESHGYLASQIRAQGGDGAEAAPVNPYAFAGVASDGRDLIELLRSPVIQTLVSLSRDAPLGQALGIGAGVLDRIVATQTADAGRVADGVGITGTTEIRGYVREAGGACCSRCAILLGSFYRYSAAFQRHPYCQCVNVPVYGTNTVKPQDPMQFFREGKITDLSAADAKAIQDGADISQVVNAHRGMSAASKGRTFGRMMPEQIYRQAGSRAEAIDLLKAHGFILGG